MATIKPEVLDGVLAGVSSPDDLMGDAGLFKQLKKALMERALGAELTHHLGYEKGDPAGRGSGNSRNGHSAKTVLTEDGELDLSVPRDRAGTFEPRLVPKGERRLDGFDGKIISLYARGLTVREIQGHLQELYGVEVSPDLISRATDAVLEEVKEWQNRPLDAVYPVVFFDPGEGPRRGPGQEQGRLRRACARCRRPQARSRPLDRAERGRQVLAEGDERPQDPRRPRRPDRRGRWLKGICSCRLR